MTPVQDTLFGPAPAPHVKGSVTSAAAADNFDAASLEQRVHDFIAAHPDVTDNDLYDAFPAHLQSTVRARRVNLSKHKGVVYGSGERAGRTTWRVVPRAAVPPRAS